eukprot:1694901-Pyramimonas_sp.AAC.1
MLASFWITPFCQRSLASYAPHNVHPTADGRTATARWCSRRPPKRKATSGHTIYAQHTPPHSTHHRTAYTIPNCHIINCGKHDKPCTGAGGYTHYEHTWMGRLS